jgi:hypothetical protein
MHARGVTIVTTSGAIVEPAFSFNSPGNSIAITVVHDANATSDALAWVHEKANPVEQQFQLLRSGGTSETPIEMSVFGACGMTAGDGDADGDADLLVVATWSSDYAVLLNCRADAGAQPTWPTFAVERVIVLPYAPYGTSTAGQRAQPLFVDLDHDFDADVVMCVQNTRDVLVQRNAAFSSSCRAVTTPAYDLGSLHVYMPAIGATPNVPDSNGDSVLFRPTHLEGTAWKVVDGRIGNVPIATLDVALETLPFLEPNLVAPAFGLGPLNIGDEFHILVRLAQRNAEGIDVLASPDEMVFMLVEDGGDGGTTGTTPLPEIGSGPSLPPPPQGGSGVGGGGH